MLSDCKAESGKRARLLITPELAFDGRLIRLAQRAIKDCLTDDYSAEIETPYWGAIVIGAIIRSRKLYRVCGGGGSAAWLPTTADVA